MERDGLTNKTMCIKEFALCEWIMKWIIQETQNEQLIFKYEKRNAEKGINKSENSTYPLNRLILQGVWIIFGSWCWGHTGNSTKKDNEFKKSTKLYAISNILQLSTNRRTLDRPCFPRKNETHEGPTTAQLMRKSSNEGAGNREETEGGVQQKTPHMFLSSEKT